MSHDLPVPKGSVSPFPLDSGAAAERDAARQELAEQASATLAAERPDRTVPIAIGAAIGSAAIAAALLYYNRSRSGSSET